MEIDYRKIGAQIRKYRKKEGLSQEQLAGMVGVGTTHISHIETGNTIPSTTTLLGIINSLRISADELFCDYLIKCRHILYNRLADCLEDCTERELAIITDTVIALKGSLRDRDKTVQK